MNLDAHDWAIVERALRFVIAREFNALREQQPRAVAWHDGWSEFRQRTIALPCGDHMHLSFEADFVMVFRNTKTQKCRERLLFRGTGESSFEATRDVLTQLSSSTSRLIRDVSEGETVSVPQEPQTFPIYNAKVLLSSGDN